MAQGVGLYQQPPFRPTWEIGASVGLHVLVFAGALLGANIAGSDESPMIDPSNVMIVNAVALPMQTTRMPELPSRTPDAPPQVETPAAPDPVPAAVESPVEPPPPVPSSDMALVTPETPKPKTQGDSTPKPRTDEREALLRQAKKEALIKDPGAPLGAVDRPRTSPNGVDISQAIFGTGSDGINDPELARWKVAVETAIRVNWTPLPTTVSAHPEYVVYVVVPIDENGKLGTPKVYQGTGDGGFDKSAIMAVMKTGKVAPPPAKWQDSTKAGVVLEFPAKAKK